MVSLLYIVINRKINQYLTMQAKFAISTCLQVTDHTEEDREGSLILNVKAQITSKFSSTS